MAEYTEQANTFIQETLVKEKGLDQKDIFSHFALLR